MPDGRPVDPNERCLFAPSGKPRGPRVMTDTPTFVTLTIDRQVAWIRIDNPAKRNSLTAADIDVFIGHLDAVAQMPAIRALIIAGGSSGTFCAGASLDELSRGELTADQFERLTDRIAAIAVPTICAMNGNAFGGGVEIGLCCDFRIGVRGMRLFVPAARFGLCYPPKGIRRYVHQLGPATTKRLLVASEELDAGTLLSVGYLTHLVEPGQADARATELAGQIAELAPLAVAAMKAICNGATDGNLDAGVAGELAKHCRQSEDLREGLRAVAERRKPVFRGK
jgi:enoyl-CoA hydratase/carnithine racemase